MIPRNISTDPAARMFVHGEHLAPACSVFLQTGNYVRANPTGSGTLPSRFPRRHSVPALAGYQRCRYSPRGLMPSAIPNPPRLAGSAYAGSVHPRAAVVMLMKGQKRGSPPQNCVTSGRKRISMVYPRQRWKPSALNKHSCGLFDMGTPCSS